MPRSDLSDVPNPFAFVDATPRRAARDAAVRAAKYLICVVLIFAALLGVRHASGKWLLSRLTQNFDSLTPIQQQSRLVKIGGMGQPAIPHLVSAMAAKDIGTARAAYDILRQVQNDWTVLGTKALRERHFTLVKSIAIVAPRLPDDRTGWATSLIQQSIMESVQQENDAARYLYRSANDTLGLLAHSSRSGPSILSSGSSETIDRSPRRLIVQSEPLPVDQTDSGVQWTDWPPTAANEQGPSIYRSAATDASVRLKPVLSDESVQLKRIAQLQTPEQIAPEIQQVQSTESLVETALEAYDDRSVMYWLNSNDPHQRQAAKLELMSRGYDENQISLAANLAHPDAKVRLHFVNQLGKDPHVDPRPWLRLMTGDENRDIRMAVVSVLTSIRDPDAMKELRTMMANESDQAVASQIRKSLNLR